MKIFNTTRIPDRGPNLLREKGYEVIISQNDQVLRKDDFIAALKADRYEAVLSDLGDHIDSEAFDAVGAQCKIFANYAVGFDNFDVAAAFERGVLLSNTPGVLTNTVAEHAFALLLILQNFYHELPMEVHRLRSRPKFGNCPNLLS